MAAIAYFDTDEAAEILKTSPATLRALRKKGTGPKYFKPFGKVLYTLDEIDRWVRDSVRTSTSDKAETR